MKEEDILKELHRKQLIPLKGLRAISVSFTPMAALLPPDSFRHQEIEFPSVEPDLEKILRQREESVKGVWPIIQNRLSEIGIQVLSNEELSNRLGQAYLGVFINLGKPKKKATCSVQLSLMQEVTLARDPEIRFDVETWKSGVISRKYPKEGKPVTGEDRRIGGIEDVVDEAIRWFMETYRAANGLD